MMLRIKQCAKPAINKYRKYWSGTDALNLIPYGISSWKFIRDSKKLFVDKTHFIRLVEKAGPYNMIHRPRRFGKTLFCDQLSFYYDAAYKSEFAHFFGHTIVGSELTEGQGQYMILRLNLSEVKTEGDLRRNLQDYLIIKIKEFSEKYRDPKHNLLPHDIDSHSDVMSHTVSNLYSAVNSSSHNIYLVIDDYDAIMSNILLNCHHSDGSDKDTSQSSLAIERVMNEFSGFVREGIYTGIIERVFLTGVMPAATRFGLKNRKRKEDKLGLRDFMTDLTFHTDFESIMGFSENDVRQVMPRVVEDAMQCERHLAILKSHYDNYRFTPTQQKAVMNPQLCLMYLQELVGKSDKPARVIDSMLLDPTNSKVNMILEDRVAQFIVRRIVNGMHNSLNGMNPVDAPCAVPPSTQNIVNFIIGHFSNIAVQPTITLDCMQDLPVPAPQEKQEVSGEASSSEPQHQQLLQVPNFESLVSLAYYYGMLTFANPTSLLACRHQAANVLIPANTLHRDLFLRETLQLLTMNPVWNQLLISYVQEVDPAQKQRIFHEMWELQNGNKEVCAVADKDQIDDILGSDLSASAVSEAQHVSPTLNAEKKSAGLLLSNVADKKIEPSKVDEPQPVVETMMVRCIMAGLMKDVKSDTSTASSADDLQ